MPRTPNQRLLLKIGRRLLEQRMRLGLSQRDLAAKARISAQQISLYERGLSDPPLSTIVKLADQLKLSPVALLGPQR